MFTNGMIICRFQHTAARRRLDLDFDTAKIAKSVSTHSRPKAAGRLCLYLLLHADGFNTQPPEGGWRIRRGFVR